MTQQNKTRVVKFLVSPNEYVRLRNLMDAKGVISISKYVRELLFRRDLSESDMIRAMYKKIVGGEIENNKK